MNIRKELNKKIQRKREEIYALEIGLGQAKAYLQALEDTSRMLPRDGQDRQETALRPGSDIAKVRDILRLAGAPLHVDAILEKLGKPLTKNAKVSLSGSLGIYVRDDKIFTRPAPNTFGLQEFDRGDACDTGEPPEDFGLNGEMEENESKS